MAMEMSIQTFNYKEKYATRQPAKEDARKSHTATRQIAINEVRT